MNLGELARQPGEWMRGEGPMSEIVISSRIRLARNVAGYPFFSKATDPQREELSGRLRSAVMGPGQGRWSYLEMAGIDELDQQVLVERHLISRQHADIRGSRGVAISPDEDVAVI